MKSIRVLKFGGSSFTELKDYRGIAQAVLREMEPAQRLVIVVSAMSGTTGRLQEAGETVNPHLSPEVRDALLGTGEMVSACLLRSAFEGEGERAVHFNGYSVGWKTNSDFQNARFQSTSIAPIRQALETHRVVVVAGGQGVDGEGRLTMLGRNSSDMTAVQIAASLGVDQCEIFSDVPGVYSADPYRVPGASLLPQVSYEMMTEMSRSGAKVLHFGAVNLAKQWGIEIVCRGIGSGLPVGTRIGGSADAFAVSAMESADVWEGDRRQKTEALAILKQAGIGVLCLPGNSPVVVTAKSDRKAVSSLLGQLKMRSARRSLVSRIECKPRGVRWRRYWTSDERLEATLRRLHGNTGASVSSIASKRKSRHSQLLAG